jgi:IS5 family transposase
VPVDEAEHKLQVLSDARSPAALQFLGYASAAQRAAGVRRLVPPVLLGSCSRKIASHLARANAPLLDRVRLFARERKNVAQEGFDALVHWVCPRYRLSA